MTFKISVFIFLLVFCTTLNTEEFSFNFKKIEKNIIKEMNFARSKPKKYAAKLETLKELYKNKILYLPDETPILTKEGIPAVDEAINAVKNYTPVATLKHNKHLSKIARKYAMEQGKSGDFGHYGRDGSTPSKRVAKEGKWINVVGESIAYGTHTGKMAVMQLIIDDGVPDRGHRKNMYKDTYRITGVGCAPHKKLRIACVIIYAFDFKKN